jgi:hypothetical protein
MGRVVSFGRYLKLFTYSTDVVYFFMCDKMLLEWLGLSVIFDGVQMSEAKCNNFTHISRDVIPNGHAE